MRDLESIPHNNSNAATYVRKSLEIFYRNDICALSSHSLTGRCSKKHDQKTPITPEKRSILSRLFRLRIQSLSISNKDKNSRSSVKVFNRILSSGLCNMERNVNKRKGK